MVESELVPPENNRKIDAAQGILAFMSRRAVHSFAKPQDVPTTLLIIFCPADSLEKYFQDEAELNHTGRIVDKEKLLAPLLINDQEPPAEDGWTS